jgi:ubiquinone/menaquinone biosynthesis C-methylase UbiE
VVESALFETRIPIKKPSYEVSYTIGLISRPRYEPELFKPINIHNPDDWYNWSDNWLTGSVEGEWYAYMFRNCQKVLDIGSGPGRPSLYIARTIPEVVGIEPGACEIEFARELKRKVGLNNVAFLQESALDLPFPDNSFDGAYFCYSLESTGDARRALLETRRVVKQEGVIAILLAPILPNRQAGMPAPHRFMENLRKYSIM